MSKKVKFIILVLLTFNCLSAKNDKIKLYTFYTPSHEKLFFQWFLPSLQDDFELIVKKYPQECPSGSFWKKGWGKTMLRKVNLILRGIKENWGNFFIYSDIDIQFFRPMQELIIKAIKDKDIVFQLNFPSGEVCAGFFVCKGNTRTQVLWENIKKIMIETKHPSDQKALNSIIRSPNYEGVTWGYLPVEFFGAGTLTGVSGTRWHPGDFLQVPDNIVLHHATCTRGVENKVKQLQDVRKIVNNMGDK